MVGEGEVTRAYDERDFWGCVMGFGWAYGRERRSLQGHVGRRAPVGWA